METLPSLTAPRKATLLSSIVITMVIQLSHFVLPTALPQALTVIWALIIFKKTINDKLKVNPAYNSRFAFIVNLFVLLFYIAL